MKTAYEAAVSRHRSSVCPVPPMDDPLSIHWKQPDPMNWKFTETEVLMPAADRDALLDYSHSQPTGVYPGKMWRKSDDLQVWYLHWFGLSERGPDWCSNGVRKIITV